MPPVTARRPVRVSLRSRVVRTRWSSRPRQAGLVVALEDVQWVDGASLELLGYLCVELPSSCLLVIGTVRDPVPDALAGLPGASVLRLGPLSRAEVAEYLGPGVDQSWSAAVHRRSGGHPL